MNTVCETVICKAMVTCGNQWWFKATHFKPDGSIKVADPVILGQCLRPLSVGLRSWIF